MSNRPIVRREVQLEHMPNLNCPNMSFPATVVMGCNSAMGLHSHQFGIPGRSSSLFSFFFPSTQNQSYPSVSSRLRLLTLSRYTLCSALGANPDHRENYQVHESGPRIPATNTTADQNDHIVNYKDAVTGFLVNGTIPVDNSQGVHSLTDVPVFAIGPCQESFGGTLIRLSHTFLATDCRMQESRTTSISSSTRQPA